MIYCANCDAEAVMVARHEDGSDTNLCYTCGTAYEWGQASPDADLVDVDEVYTADSFRPEEDA